MLLLITRTFGKSDLLLFSENNCHRLERLQLSLRCYSDATLTPQLLYLHNGILSATIGLVALGRRKEAIMTKEYFGRRGFLKYLLGLGVFGFASIVRFKKEEGFLIGKMAGIQIDTPEAYGMCGIGAGCAGGGGQCGIGSGCAGGGGTCGIGSGCAGSGGYNGGGGGYGGGGGQCGIGSGCAGGGGTCGIGAGCAGGGGVCGIGAGCAGR